MNRFSLVAIPLALAGAALLTYHQVYASDHDDGDTDLKSRALNLTDHFAFKSPTAADQLSIVTYFSPRDLPGKQYFMSTAARYEQHINKVADKTDAATVTLGTNTPSDYTFRYEAAAPDATGAQDVTVTLLEGATVVGTATGKTTTYANSKAGNLTVNNSTIGTFTFKWFIGPRADSFHFDVIRFFQVRAFLAQRFFGGAGGIGDATAALPPNCRGDGFFAEGAVPDADAINLWNPPSCAPDFTKNLNVMSIAMNAEIAQLGGTVFDTWDTISVSQ